MSDVTVLVSSAGRRGALIQALREGGELAGASVRIVVTDLSPLSAAGHMADGFLLVPPVTSPSFVDAMVAIVERESVDVIVPTIDPELPVFAANRDRLAEAGARVLVSDLETISITSDKERSSRWMAQAGFSIPVQYSEGEIDDLATDAWPLFFKPRQGSSSIGAHRVGSPAEMKLATERFGAGVVEELIVGDEYTMDCWSDKSGTCLSVVPRRRLAIRAGEIAKGITVRDDRLESEVRAMVQALPGVQGPTTVQAIVGSDGPRFIEINPRFGGGYPLSHHAGARYTAALVAEVVGKPVDPAWFSWADDVVMLRYDEAVFVSKTEIDLIS